MKTVGFLLLALITQSCFYQSYYKDKQWWYFEEWDTNNDSVVDRDEFAAGVKKSKIIGKDTPTSDSAAFAVADDNKDNKLSGIEFYKWEISL
jgi:hypothetical protein